MSKKNILKNLSLSRKIAIGFLIAIFFGAIILKMPISLNEGKELSLIDSFFTIISAICVTGLTVVDFASTFSYVGKSIVLFYIQIGGIGVMTFSLMIFFIIGSKISFGTKELLKEERNTTNIGGIGSAIRILIVTVLVIEGIGATILSYEFAKIMPLKKAMYFGVFHAISAFCNAGFSLFSNNIEGFIDNTTINLTLGYLITFGGLGFSVIHSFILFVRKKVNRFNLTSKLSLFMSIILTFVAMFLFFALEYNNSYTLANLTLKQKLLASYFQGVNLRTSGFNTVPLDHLRPATICLSIILMFIGASPGSTGGGIKTTTFIILIFYAVGILKKKEHIEIYGRRIDWDIMNKAIAIFILSLFYITVIVFFMICFQDSPTEAIFYEVFSAFGTVGLSMGITPELNIFSKILIMMTMFVGRLGPMTFALAITGDYKKNITRYPKEDVLVG